MTDNWRHDDAVDQARARAWLGVCAAVLGFLAGIAIAALAQAAMRPVLGVLATLGQVPSGR